jgi:hypothetical protein
MVYSIYHIPGIKIGCSKRVQQRVKEQGYTQFEILETHSDIDIASKREIELQKQYGYEEKFTRVRYSHTAKMGYISGANNVKSGHIYTITNKEAQSRGGRIGIKNVKIEDKIKGAKIAGNITANKIHNCPHCNKNIKGRVYFRWHGENCKYA